MSNEQLTQDDERVFVADESQMPLAVLAKTHVTGAAWLGPNKMRVQYRVKSFPVQDRWEIHSVDFDVEPVNKRVIDYLKRWGFLH